MKIIPVKTKIFKKNESLIDFLTSCVPSLSEKDIIAITSKIVSLSQGNVLPLFKKNEAVKRESEETIKNKYCLLTKKEKDWLPGAGIDKSNANGKIILLPKNPFEMAQKLSAQLKKHYKLKKLGVIITDSRSRPLRNGTSGITLGYHGFYGIKSYKNKKDIFKRDLKYTRVNVTDSLASVAVLLMGEGDEKTPIAIIKNAPACFTNKKGSLKELIIEAKDDYYKEIFISSYLKNIKKQNK